MASVLKSLKAKTPSTSASMIHSALVRSNVSRRVLAESGPPSSLDPPSLWSRISPYLSYLSLPSLSGASASTVFFTILAIIATMLVLEQVVYRRKKKHLPGPKWTIPLIGKFADSLNPTMANYQRGWDSGPLNVASVFNMFIVVAASTNYTRKILTSPTYTEPCLVASAKKVLLHDNWVFLNGKAHVDFRKGLNTLFTRKALSSYLATQEIIYKQHFSSWLSQDQDGKFRPYAGAIRDLNMDTSLRVFCGNYITSTESKEVAQKYWLISTALELVNFPFALPGTKIYKAVKARELAMKLFERAAGQSKKHMSAGGQASCLTDEWVKAMLDAREHTADETSELTSEQRRVLVREFSDREIAMVLMSFLFASQDAMSSALVFLFQFMADRPDILQKVREEQYAQRGDDLDAPVTLEQVDRMEYARVVVKESLRIRPPVIMVPYLAHRDFPIDDKYTVPKGSMVIPSFWPALHDPEVFEDPDTFIPERWLDPNSPANTNVKHWVVFGAGPHNCIGQQYALMHLTAVLGAASVSLNWEHEVTPESQEFSMLPTIFPKDGARLRFTQRKRPSPGTSSSEAAAAPS